MSEIVTRVGNLITLKELDVDKWVRITEPGNVIIRVDNFNPALGDTITVEHVSLAHISFDMCDGATLRIQDHFTPYLLGMYSVVTLKCIGDNEWNVFGALAPKPAWELAIQCGFSLTFGLNPTVDVDWANELALLEQQIGTLIPPTLDDIQCVVKA